MAEQKTLDNPNDISMREVQARERLEQSAAEKQRELSRNLEPIRYGEQFVFRFRKILTGSFSGLWELAAINRAGRVEEIIVDADALPHVLEAVSNIFMNAGF